MSNEYRSEGYKTDRLWVDGKKPEGFSDEPEFTLGGKIKVYVDPTMGPDDPCRFTLVSTPPLTRFERLQQHLKENYPAPIFRAEVLKIHQTLFGTEEV